MYKITIRYRSGRFNIIDPVTFCYKQGNWLQVVDKDDEEAYFNLTEVELFTVSESSVVPE